jgi:phage/plasmid-like protein (TIGR03299 family)
MSHELTIRQNGFVEFARAYGSEAAWHSLGQEVPENATLDDWRAAAGFDWRIQRSKVRFATAQGQDFADFAEMPEQHVLMRSDTKAPLGIVSDKFKVVQPQQILEEMHELTEGAGFKLETAGTMFGGRKFWTLASIGDSCEIVPGDKVGGYLLLATATDGSMATTGTFTTVRVVCNNTLTMALGATKGQQHKISHRSRFSMAAMKDGLGIAHEQFHHFKHQALRLANKSVSREQAERLTLQLMAPKSLADIPHASADDIAKVTESRGFRSIQALFEGQGKGSTLDGVQGTAWGWLNAVTEYTDHHVRATSDENRTHSAWFGQGEALKSAAADLALSFAA